MASTWTRLAIVALVVAAARPAALQAQVADAATVGHVQRDVRAQLGASINNPGLQQTVEVAWTRPTATSSHPLLSGAHVAAGVVGLATPALARAGGWLEYGPLSLLDIRAGLEPAVYFGTFHALLSFPSASAPFDRATRDARSDGRPAVGARAYLSPALKFRRGRFSGRLSADLEHWRASADGPYVYEPTRDTLYRASGDSVVSSSGVALYQHDLDGGRSVSAGVLHQFTRVASAPGNRTQRVGVLAVSELGARTWRLPNLRVTATVFRYLDDPSKRHQWGGAVAIGVRNSR